MRVSAHRYGRLSEPRESCRESIRRRMPTTSSWPARGTSGRSRDSTATTPDECMGSASAWWRIGLSPRTWRRRSSSGPGRSCRRFVVRVPSRRGFTDSPSTSFSADNDHAAGAQSRIVAVEDPEVHEMPRAAGLDEPAGRASICRRRSAACLTGARRVFCLHDVEGFSHPEIAAMIGIAVGTSKAHLHRARKLLRKALEK